MLRLYHFGMGLILILYVNAQTPFVFNATLEQQSAASNDELISNITDLIANRSQPILAGEEGVSTHLTSSIIELTTWQEQEISTRFSSLMVDLTVTDGLGLVCPTTYGLSLRYMSLFHQNEQGSTLLQVLSVVQFVKCQHTIPPGSCLDQQANGEAPYCYCCLRHRLQSVLAVAVQSCATGQCQLVIQNVNVPYCTCCQVTPDFMTVANSPAQSTSAYTSDVRTTSTDQTSSEALLTSRRTTVTPWSSTRISSSSPFYPTTNPRFTSRRTPAHDTSVSSQTAPPFSTSTAGHVSTTTAARQATTTHTSSNPTTTHRVTTTSPTT